MCTFRDPIFIFGRILTGPLEHERLQNLDENSAGKRKMRGSWPKREPPRKTEHKRPHPHTSPSLGPNEAGEPAQVV